MSNKNSFKKKMTKSFNDEEKVFKKNKKEKYKQIIPVFHYDGDGEDEFDEEFDEEKWFEHDQFFADQHNNEVCDHSHEIWPDDFCQYGEYDDDL